MGVTTFILKKIDRHFELIKLNGRPQFSTIYLLGNLLHIIDKDKLDDGEVFEIEVRNERD